MQTDMGDFEIRRQRVEHLAVGGTGEAVGVGEKDAL
jgi:hypothetical protein